jgi:hypothetical protein
MTFVCVLIVAAIGIPILQRTSQLQKQALSNWDSVNYAALLPPRVAQFRGPAIHRRASLAFPRIKVGAPAGPRHGSILSGRV